MWKTHPKNVIVKRGQGKYDSLGYIRFLLMSLFRRDWSAFHIQLLCLCPTSHPFWHISYFSPNLPRTSACITKWLLVVDLFVCFFGGVCVGLCGVGLWGRGGESIIWWIGSRFVHSWIKKAWGVISLRLSYLFVLVVVIEALVAGCLCWIGHLSWQPVFRRLF